MSLLRFEFDSSFFIFIFIFFQIEASGGMPLDEEEEEEIVPEAREITVSTVLKQDAEDADAEEQQSAMIVKADNAAKALLRDK